MANQSGTVACRIPWKDKPGRLQSIGSNRMASWSRPPPTYASTGVSGHSWACLDQFLAGSLLLSPGSWCRQGSVCVLQESVSPVLCKFWWFCSRVSGDLLQEGLRYTQVCCPQAPAAGHWWHVPPQETLRHSSGSVSVGWASILCPSHVWVPQATRCLASTLFQAAVHLNHLPGPGCLVSWVCHESTSQVCHTSPLESWSQAATLLEDVNHPGSQENMVSSWEPAHSSVEDALSAAELSGHKSASLTLGGEGPIAAG